MITVPDVRLGGFTADLLAQNNFGDTRSGGLAGPTGLVIILLLVIGTILLIRNMNSRLRKLPERFDPDRFERPPSGRNRSDLMPDNATNSPEAPPASRGDSGPADQANRGIGPHT